MAILGFDHDWCLSKINTDSIKTSLSPFLYFLVMSSFYSIFCFSHHVLILTDCIR